MQDFRNLKVWEKAHALTLEVYRVTAAFPRAERFALVDQLRRSASSIPTNIAEGCGRETDRDFAQFINIAAGSASECEYQLLLAKDLGYLDGDVHRQLDERVNEVKRMLNALGRKLRAKS